MFNKPFEVKGKHATYIRFLNSETLRRDKDAKVAPLFAVAADIYVVAPLIGASYKKRSPVDVTSENRSDSFTIFGDAIINRQKQLDDVYRLIMLGEESTNLTADERVERAFRSDENEEQVSQNMELFHDYMRGGIEWLYEKVTEGLSISTATDEDYIGKIKEILKQYADDFELPY